MKCPEGTAVSRRDAFGIFQNAGKAAAIALVLGGRSAAFAEEAAPKPASETVQTTASGVKYTILKSTSAPGDAVGLVEKAEAGDVVIVNIVAKTLDGQVVMDTTKDGKGFAIPLGKKKVIQGLEDGIIGMKAGEVRQLKIPAGPLTQPLNKDLDVMVTYERKSNLMKLFMP